MPLGFGNLAAPYLQHERLKIFVGTSILENSTRIFKDAKKYMWIHIETHIQNLAKCHKLICDRYLFLLFNSHLSWFDSRIFVRGNATNISKDFLCVCRKQRLNLHKVVLFSTIDIRTI
jgi:hypothetical protein